MSPPEVEELLRGGGRYDPTILPQLEAHLKDQLEKGTYDLEANLAILKLYLLQPDETKVEIIEGILLKALMAFPATDFSLCMFQIPQKYHTNLRDPVKLAQQLEMAKFKAFWKEAESVEILATAKGWETAVRTFIAGVVSATYRSSRKAELAELMNLAVKEVEPVIKQNGWTQSKEDKEIIIVSTATFESQRIEAAKAQSGNTKMSLENYKSLYMAASGN
eukprot:gnl/TRDRNA2_/TRDRNA2_184777_c0_seq1.p1 gnl/TRDRNA2_/TRDRNA2_184777_c0~~gnl/TRDRNA2_/TRDRNA2_184777_c0_seq1.p1  ORF type:complete len:220 (-),score=62.61 gnl/TRDRNA2_/TRDRNA2_184777_c0_seq1:55-714(-)